MRPLGPPEVPEIEDGRWGAGELMLRTAAGRVDGQGIALYDVRSAGRYAAGHLPGAMLLTAAIEDDRLVCGAEATVIYGGMEAGPVARAYRLLLDEGCEVGILDGGVSAWRAAGGELMAGEMDSGDPIADGDAEIALPRADSGSPRVMSLDELRASLGAPAQVILDLRSGDGEIKVPWPRDFRQGHVPGSLPFDLTTLMPGGGRWPEPARVRRVLGEFGPREISPVELGSTFVLLGQDGDDERGVIAFTLLRMAGLDAVVVPEGWQGWVLAGHPRVRILDAGQLRRMMDESRSGAVDLLVVDLRERRDHALRHLPGAVSVPPTDHTGEDIVELVRQRWPGKELEEVGVALYCYGPECTRSWIAAEDVARHGIKRILWLRGGIDEWRQAGLSTPGSLAQGEAGI